MKLHLGLWVLAFFVLARAAVAADHEAGVPLSPAEAAGGWTLEAHGHPICMVRLTAGFGAQAGPECAGALPTAVSGWRPTSNGMALTDQSGQPVMRFNRWSNSLFVSSLANGEDVQLMRGGPNP